MISVSNLAKSYGDRTLFADAAFQLNPGERYGLVGANGSGKTTLLGILAGDIEPTEGTVAVPKSARLGVLRQDQFLYEDEPILSVALRGHEELWRAISEKEEMLARAEAARAAAAGGDGAAGTAGADRAESDGAAEPGPSDGAGSDFDVDRFAELEETIQRLDGYAAEARAGAILEGLGIPADVHHDPLSTLSGGFKLRVLLAQVLAGSPDVLLLDEPTNHLDILSIRWLEGFLREFPGPVVVISHDRRFLDVVCTKILDVDYGTVTLYHGNYTEFVERKKEERERREKEIETRRKEIAEHQRFVDRFRAKASKARQAQSKLRLIEKKAEELVELPGSSRRYPTFRFEQRRRSGKEVLRVEGIRKAYGDNEVLHGVDLEVRRGERVAIIGPNGIGKSTLLKIVVGELEPDAGDVEWGYETYPGYFAQDHHEQLDAGADSDGRTAEEWLWDFCPDRDRGFVRAHLGLMLFSGDEGEKRLDALSGGEAARLVFARLLLERPNVLVLDEPTNHLDLEAIESLVAGLEDYDGTLILVSHDRWFVRRLATRIVEITRDGVRDFKGTYEEFLHAGGDDRLDIDSAVIDARRERRKGAGGDGRASGSEGRGGSGGRGPSGGRGRDSRGGGSGGDGASSGGRKGGSRGGRARGGRRGEREQDPEIRARRLASRRDDLLAEIDEAESRIAEIDATFGRPGYFNGARPDEVNALERERSDLAERLAALMEEWERLERELAAVG